MEGFLRGLLHDLECRCVLLCDRLTAIQADPDVSHHVLDAYQGLETARREIVQLLNDPSLGTSALLPNHLQQYKRWHESIILVESYPIVFVERYAEPDRRLTRLCRQLVHQVRWPLPPPLVATFSNQYYWTVPRFNLVCIPTGELHSLLGLADLCHELGHILLAAHRGPIIGDFLVTLTDYIRQEQQRVIMGQRSPDYLQLYSLLFAQWQDEWLAEFVSDMVATYLVGPAFGWQHVRLCASMSQGAFRPALGDADGHPADEARLRGLSAVLGLMGAAGPQADLQALWDRYLVVSGDRRSADYSVCYPQMLIDFLARHVVDGCRALGVRGFDAAAKAADDIPTLLCDAWEKFLAEPQSYAAWEGQKVEAIWQQLGF